MLPPTFAPPPPEPTPMPEPAFATARDNLRVRSLPSTSGAILDRLNKGDRVEILGRTGANDWWQIALPTDPNRFGWVSADFTDVVGAIDAVPIVQPGAKPPPTNAPGVPPAPKPPGPYPYP